MTNNHSIFLKEMGITEWTSRDAVQSATEAAAPAGMSAGVSAVASTSVIASEDALPERISYGAWWFFGNEPQGDAKVLFQNIIRVLGLSNNEWSWKNPSANLSQLLSPETPVVAVAFGGPVAQKITGEKDPLPMLRETVLALNASNEEEIPVIASFELNQALMNPREKALLWQDLLLARSVLQNT